ncbi:MAG: flippase [Candidatus Krumholzibacteria bacterium]|nr:flippase [Candidatus Krumholzibacteria bacterium]
MSFIRNVSITFNTKVALFFVGLVTSIIIARTIGPEGKGLFTLALTAAAVVVNTTNLGVGMGSGYFLGRRRVPFDLLAGNWLGLSLITGVSALAISVALAPFLVPRFLPSVPTWYVIAALLSIPFTFMFLNFQALFKANNDFRRFNILAITQPASLLLIFVVLIQFFPERKLDVVIVVFLLSHVVVGTLAICLTAGVTRLRFRLSRDVAGAALRFGLQGYLANFLAFLNLRLDVLLVNFFMAPISVGYYAISVMVAEKIWYIPDVLSAVLHPRVAHGTEEDANRDTAIVTRQTVLAIVLGCVGVLLFGRFLIELFYTKRFLPAVTPLFILLPGIFTASLARVISSDLLARGYPRVIMWGGVAGVLSNVGLNVVLIPRFGVSGAALATTISYTLNAVVVIAAFVNITGVSPRVILVPGTADIRLMAKGARQLLTFRKGVRSVFPK